MSSAIRVSLACLLLNCLFGSVAEAGKARDYLNAPKDTWVTFYNAGYTTSATPVEGGEDFGVPDIGSDVLSQSVILTRIVDVWGRTGGVSLILPYVDLSLDLGDEIYHTAGVADLRLAWEVNLFGAPALSKEEFGNWTPETFASIHFVLSAPTADYDPDEPLNTGSNRWVFTPTINYSYTPDEGVSWLDGYATMKLFSENEATNTEQSPLFLFEAHASRNVTERLWLSIDAYYNAGGETHVSGEPQDDAANTLRLGLGSGMRLWDGAQMMLNWGQVVTAPGGQPEGMNFRLSLAQVW
jgi:hypothetical protein